MDLEIIKPTNRISTSSRIMKAAFAVAFFSHLVFIAVVHQFIPQFWQTNELRTYSVELIRDSIDDIPLGELEELSRENSLKKLIDSKSNSEKTISLDTKDKRYIAYATLIKKRLSSCWGYPVEAKNRLMEGKSRLIFSLSQAGQLTEISIIESSGYKILDREGADTIRRAAPFPPFPESITANKLNLDVSFEYRITSSKSLD